MHIKPACAIAKAYKGKDVTGSQCAVKIFECWQIVQNLGRDRVHTSLGDSSSDATTDDRDGVNLYACSRSSYDQRACDVKVHPGDHDMLLFLTGEKHSVLLLNFTV